MPYYWVRSFVWMYRGQRNPRTIPQMILGVNGRESMAPCEGYVHAHRCGDYYVCMGSGGGGKGRPTKWSSRRNHFLHLTVLKYVIKMVAPRLNLTLFFSGVWVSQSNRVVGLPLFPVTVFNEALIYWLSRLKSHLRLFFSNTSLSVKRIHRRRLVITPPPPP